MQDKKQTKQINKNDGEIERRSLYNNTIKAVLSCMEQSSSNLLWPGLVIRVVRGETTDSVIPFVTPAF